MTVDVAICLQVPQLPRAPASCTSVRALVAMGATAAPSGGRGSRKQCCCACGAVIVALVAVVTAIVVNAPPTSTYVSLPPLMRAINAAGDVLDAVGIDPAPVDYESVIAAAVAAAGGLTDVDIPGWGCECAASDSAAQPRCTSSGCASHGTLDDGAMASLRVLTDELVARVKAGEVTFMGRLMLRDGMVRALANRLQVRGVTVRAPCGHARLCVSRRPVHTAVRTTLSLHGVWPWSWAWAWVGPDYRHVEAAPGRHRVTEHPGPCHCHGSAAVRHQRDGELVGPARSACQLANVPGIPPSGLARGAADCRRVRRSNAGPSYQCRATVRLVASRAVPRVLAPESRLPCAV